MSCYATSSQRSVWSFSKDEIVQRRKVSRNRALTRINAKGLENDAISVEQERTLLCYYERRIVNIVKSMKLPTKSAATAVSYFKRFFLDRSIMDFNPSVVTLSAIYAAFKVEETVVEAQVLCEQAPTDGNVAEEIPASVILSVELGFFEALKFQLVCFHPYRSLEALIKQLLDSAQDRDRAAEIGKVAREIITTTAIHTDLQFRYPPAKIALGTLKDAALRIKESLDMTGLLKLILEKERGGIELLNELESEVDEIVKELRSCSSYIVEAGNHELMADMERRRRRCSLPENDPQSDVYKRKEKKIAEKRERRHAKKARRAEKKVRRERAELTGVPLEEDDEDDSSEDDESDVQVDRPPSPKRAKTSVA
ncbi:hypothetical protein NDN08_003761 [Rhodosorus marinus]|uniref:Cyclin-like domain-containing protein n=1 Tax=Rhodosorus marinus TaxID=101924 RepID=A0AAV8UK45_9RHOD|nr:hypothetical protein NDN08_003761 [Rhodosorus marinus]